MSDHDKKKDEGLTPEEFEEAYQRGEKWADQMAKDILKVIEKHTSEKQPADKDLRNFIRNTFIINAKMNKEGDLYEKRLMEQRKKDSQDRSP